MFEIIFTIIAVTRTFFHKTTYSITQNNKNFFLLDILTFCYFRIHDIIDNFVANGLFLKKI